ncbi:MAG: hypothetical protein ABJC36_04220 [Gemmatimonadales bacterium]
MTICTELSDRMPEVAHGRSQWTESEDRHLATCADCHAEWDLVTAVMRLGATLPPPGDSARLTALLLERLGRERERLQRQLRIWTAAGLTAAAAVIVAIWTGALSEVRPAPRTESVTSRVATTSAPLTPERPTSRGDTGHRSTGIPTPSAPEASGAPALAAAPAGSPPSELPLPEIDDLPAEALDSMLQGLDEPGARADAYELPGLGDSGDRELEAALTGLEG